MRINNVSSETSMQTVVILSVIATVVTGGLLIGYLTTSDNLSFFGFFQWLFLMFQSLREECKEEDPFIPWIFLALFIGVYGGLFASIIGRHFALSRFNSGLNIKYINLLQGRIEFFFTRPEYNFACAYSDIENLNMDIESTLVHTKHGTQIAFRQLNLTFTLLNNKKFELSNTTSSPINTIYNIIAWTRGVQKFNYKFSGYGEIPDYKEKIDKYLQSGYKDIVGRNGETTLKWLSILFFTIGIIFVFSFKDVIEDSVKDPFALIIISPLLLFILISFIFDIILVIDKIRDNKFRGYNG